MKEFKINREAKAKLPPKEVIEKYKDFKKLHTDYNEVMKRPRKPLYKNKKLFMFLLLLAIAAWVLADHFGKEETPSEPTLLESPEH